MQPCGHGQRRATVQEHASKHQISTLGGANLGRTASLLFFGPCAANDTVQVPEDVELQQLPTSLLELDLHILPSDDDSGLLRLGYLTGELAVRL
jgi:hypothetical protein